MDRRTVVRLLGVALLGSTAACQTQDGGAEGPAASPTGSPSETSTQTQMTTETDPQAEETETPTDERSTATGTDESDGGAAAEGLVTVTTEDSVEATVERIEADIEESPLTLMTTVDHAENAASVDRELPPTTLLIFGNPEVGTPLMQAARTVAIDLPQKMLVWDDDGQTTVAYNDPQYLAERHGIGGESERLEQVGSALNQLATGGE